MKITIEKKVREVYEYCRDCDRSIYGEYPSCDMNIENNGKYVRGDSKCYCKIVNGKRAEKYPWENEVKRIIIDSE